MSVAAPTAFADVRPVDLGLALSLAGAVLVAAGVALHAGTSSRAVAIAEPTGERVVRVVPVVDPDLPLLKLGGQRDPSRLPDRFVHQAPRARVAERAFVSTKAGKAAEDAPAPEVKMADADAKPPPPDAELAKAVDTPAAVVPDAGAPANVAEQGHADGVKDGTEVDPLKARAVDLYRAKIAAWFSGRFRVSGSGLAEADLLKYRVSAVVSVSPDRTVSGFTVASSGNAAFDAAAARALEGAKGQSLPPPPENYPDVAQSRISVTFVCRENRCD